MVKKAKIDLLDTEVHLEDKAPPRDEDPGVAPPDLDRQATRLKKIAGWIASRLRRWTAGRRKYLFILGIVFILLALAGGAVWFYTADKERKEALSRERDALKTPGLTEEAMGMFKHFVVDVRDAKGEMRLLLCDVFVEFDRPETALREEDRIEIRKRIHAVLKRTTMPGALTPEGRKVLKVELQAELRRLLGDRAVKEVYFTKFEGL